MTHQRRTPLPTQTSGSSHSPRHPPFFPPSAGNVRLDDLHVFDPAKMTWTDLSAAINGPRPSARSFHGFTSAGGKLYVHGGLKTGGTQGCSCLPSLFLSFGTGTGCLERER